MRKYIKTILCSAASFAIMATNVSAAGNMNLTWRGDYSDNNAPKIVLTFESPAQYIQEVGVVIYDKDVTTPSLDDYVEIGEATSNNGAQTSISFDLNDSFSEANGAYKADIFGSGYMYEVCNDSAVIYVIRKGAIPGLLTQFNSASASDFADVLDSVMPHLQLENEPNTARKAQRIAKMIDMRTKDFNGQFETLEDIKSSWIISDLLVYMQESPVAADLKDRVIANADIIGIETENSDLKLYADALFEMVKTYSAEYKNNEGVKCKSDLKDYIYECLGVMVANNSTNDEITSSFSPYFVYYDISEAKKTIYNGFTVNQKDKVLRALYNKNFRKPAEVVTAIENAIISIGGNANVPSGNTSPVVVPPKGDGSSGGTITGGNTATFEPQDPTIVSGFGDVQASHWAYNDITMLVNKGIVNGYDDNTFKPNNNVTRAEFIKMVIGASGLYDGNAKCVFSDVTSNSWAYKYVASAYEKNIVAGIDDTTFGANNNITREDVAVIIARVLKYYGALGDNLGSVLTDVDSVSDYAVDSVEILSGMGVINGYDDNTFRPQNTLTRAESAAIISRLIKLL